MREFPVEAVTRLCMAVGRDLLAGRADPAACAEVEGRPGKIVADMAAHAALVAGLSALDPAVPVISEEDLDHAAVRPERYWLIDPIDGTASWKHGFPGFVTQIAYMENAVPVFGIVHGPALQQTFAGIRGQGASCNGVALPRLGAGGPVVMIDNTPQPHGITARLMAALGAERYVESGSLGLKTVRIADGTASLFVKDVVVRDWDLAPAAVILHEVGGVLWSLTGMPYSFDGAIEKQGGFVAAANVELAERACAAAREQGAG